MGFAVEHTQKGKQLLPWDSHNLACVLPDILTLSPSLRSEWETEKLTAILKRRKRGGRPELHAYMLLRK